LEALRSAGVNVEPIRERNGKLTVGGVFCNAVDEEITDSMGSDSGRGPDLPVGLGPVAVTSIEGKTVSRGVVGVPVGLHGVDGLGEDFEAEELVTIKVVGDTPHRLLTIS